MLARHDEQKLRQNGASLAKAFDLANVIWVVDRRGGSAQGSLKQTARGVAARRCENSDSIRDR
jgi:hypothetical protein